MTDTSELEFFEAETLQGDPPTSHGFDVSSVERMLSACTGALFTTVLVTPLDVVKTRLQSQDLPRTACDVHFNGTADGLVKIIRHEGPSALWRGLSAGLVMAVPSTMIYFVGYDWIREQTRQAPALTNTAVHEYSPLWAGGLARTVAAAIISPIELFRTRLQSTEGKNAFRDSWQGVLRMIHSEGSRTLWRGLLPTLLRDVPFSAIYWMGYERMKQRLYTHGDAVTDFQTSFAAGASSGMIAAVVTTPFDVLKTQRQVTKDRDIRLGRLLRQIVAQDGYRGFFRGVVPRAIKVAPSCAIMISSYEVGKRLFADRRRAQ